MVTSAFHLFSTEKEFVIIHPTNYSTTDEFLETDLSAISGRRGAAITTIEVKTNSPMKNSYHTAIRCLKYSFWPIGHFVHVVFLIWSGSRRNYINMKYPLDVIHMDATKNSILRVVHVFKQGLVLLRICWWNCSSLKLTFIVKVSYEAWSNKKCHFHNVKFVFFQIKY